MRQILTEQSSEAEAKNELSPKLTQLMGPLWPWQVATATPDPSFMFQILTEQSLEPDARRSWGVSEGFFHRPIEKQYIVIIMIVIFIIIIVIFIIMIVIFIIIYSVMGLLSYKAQKCIWYCQDHTLGPLFKTWLSRKVMHDSYTWYSRNAQIIINIYLHHCNQWLNCF